MLEERVVVVRVDGSQAWVRPLGPEQCRRCAEGRGCGGGFFSRLVRRRPNDIPARHRLDDLRSGEQVVVGMREDALLTASVLVYLLPLAGMFAFGAFAHLGMEAIDLIVAIFGVAGLLFGLACTRMISARIEPDPRFQLEILRRARPDPEHCARLPLAALHRDP